MYKIVLFLNVTFSEIAWAIFIRFLMEPYVKRVLTIWMVLPHWTRLLPCPYMVKMLKNLLQNQESFEAESWYTALGFQSLLSLFKWWLWTILQYGPICVLIAVAILEEVAWYLQIFLSSERIMVHEPLVLIFPWKQVLTFLANCLLKRQFAWNVKSCFLGKIRKISICCLLN